MAGLDGFVKLLLHCDGTDTSTTFTDSSDQAHTVTAVADAQVDTAQSKFGGASALFDGTGDSLTVPDSSDWDLWSGTGSSTIDFWVRFAALPADDFSIDLIGQAVDTSNYWDIFVYNSSGTYHLYLKSRVGGTIDFEYWGILTGLSIDTWYHFAIEENAGTANFYLDGVLQTKDVTAGFISPTLWSVPLTIAPTTWGAPLNGWIDELRISKGIARYNDNNFTAPTVAYSPPAPDSWWKDLATPPDPLLSISTSSQKANLFTWEPTLETAAAATAALNEFRGWFVPLTDPVRIPPRLETGDQQFEIVTFKPILRRTKSIAGSHDGTPLLHGLHDKTSQIAIKVNS